MDDNDGMLRLLETAVLRAALDQVIDMVMKDPGILDDPATPGEELRLIKAVYALRRYRRQLVVTSRRKNRKED